MNRSAYGRSECWICGRVISVAGFAQHNHKMMHVRRGEMMKIVKHSHGHPNRPSPAYDRIRIIFKIREKGKQARAERLKGVKQ